MFNNRRERTTPKVVDLDLSNGAGALESSCSILPGRVLVAWTDLAQVVHVTDIRTPSLELLASRTDRIVGLGRYPVLADTRLAYRVTGIEHQWETFTVALLDLDTGYNHDYLGGSSGNWPIAIRRETLAWQGLVAQGYPIHVVEQSGTPTLSPQHGRPTGLARLKENGLVVLNDDNRDVLPYCFNPQFADGLIVGEGRTDPAHVVVQCELGTSRALWIGRSSRTPRCAVLNGLYAITSQGRIWVGTAVDIAALPLASSVTEPPLVIEPFAAPKVLALFKASRGEILTEHLPVNARVVDMSEGIGEVGSYTGDFTMDVRIASFAGGGSAAETAARLAVLPTDVPRVVWCEDQWDAVFAMDAEVYGIQIWPDRFNPGETAEQILARCAPRFDEAARRTAKPLAIILRQSDGRWTTDGAPFYAFDLRTLFRLTVPLLRWPQVKMLLGFSW